MPRRSRAWICADVSSTAEARSEASPRATPSAWSIRSPPRTRRSAVERRPARDAGGSGGALRPALVQAQGRRRCEGRRRAPDARSRRCSTASPQPYHASLDGNEQYDDFEGVAALWSKMKAEPRLKRLVDEHHLLRAAGEAAEGARSEKVAGIDKPVIIDESDDSLDAFPRAKALGYKGVSSKTCKGIYKSLINRARCAGTLGARRLLHVGRGPHHPGRARAAAGSGAGFAARASRTSSATATTT